VKTRRFELAAPGWHKLGKLQSSHVIQRARVVFDDIIQSSRRRDPKYSVHRRSVADNGGTRSCHRYFYPQHARRR
jgi:hypothetical protein